jgi:purine-binding chemotaxis protein CheW
MSSVFDTLRRSIVQLEESIARGSRITPQVEDRILRERTARVAREPPEMALLGAVSVLAFERAGRRYAVPLEGLSEVTPLVQIAPVPGLPAPYLGVTARRGKVVAVVDLPRLFRSAPSQAGEPKWLVMAATREVLCGVAADRMHDLVDVSATSLSPSMPTFPALVQRYTAGVLQDRTVVIDLPGLLSDPALRVEDRDV